jgi:hypothetical protein
MASLADWAAAREAKKQGGPQGAQQADRINLGLATLQSDPDTAARDQQTAEATGWPVDVVRRNPEDAAKRALLKKVDAPRLQREAPAVAKYVSNPRNLELVAADDYNVLEDMARTAEILGNMVRPRPLWEMSTPERIARDVAQNIPKSQRDHEIRESALRSLKGEGTAFDEARIARLQNVPTRDFELGLFAGMPGAIADQWRLRVQQFGAGLLGFGVGVGGGVAAGATMGIPGMLHGGVGGGATGAALAAYMVSAQAETAGIWLDIRDTVDDDGVKIDQDYARGLAMAGGMLAGAFETLGSVTMLSRLPGVQKLFGGQPFAMREAMKGLVKNQAFKAATLETFKAMAVGGSVEFGTEFMQDITGAFTKLKALDKQGKDIDEFIVYGADGVTVKLTGPEAILANAFASGRRGFQGGGGMAAGGAILTQAQNFRKSREAKERQPLIEKLLRAAGKSELTKRKPGALEEFYEGAEEQGAPTHFFIPEEAVREFFQDPNLTEEKASELIEKMPSLARMAGEVELTGADFVIPVGEFTENAAETDFGAAMMEHIRLDDDQHQFTATEAAEHDSAQAEQIADLRNTIDADIADQQVEAKLRGLLTEQIGKQFSPSVTESYVDLTVQRYLDRGRRSGKTLRQILDDEGIFRVEPAERGEPEVVQPSLDEKIRKQRVTNMVAEVRSGKEPELEGLPQRPILSILAGLGGVDPASPFGGDLQKLIPRSGEGSLRGLFQEGGLAELGDLDLANEELFAGNLRPTEEGGARLDAGELMEAIREELAGRPLRTEAQQAVIGEAQRERAELREAMERAELDLDDKTDAEIAEELIGREFFQPSLESAQVPDALRAEYELEADEAIQADPQLLAEHNAAVEVSERLWAAGALQNDYMMAIRDRDAGLIEEALEGIGDRQTWAEIVEEQEGEDARSFDIDNADIFDLAIQDKGLTDDINEAGYILPDGRMLDFSGKRNGGQPGNRAEDHRQIVSQAGVSGSDAMIAFQRTGAVRVDAAAHIADFETMPSRSALRKVAELFDTGMMEEPVYIDASDAGGRRTSFIAHSPDAISQQLGKFYRGQDVAQGREFFQPATPLDDTNPGRVSTRNPTAVSREQDPLAEHLSVDHETNMLSAASFDKNVAAIRKYVNLPEVAGETSQETAERFIQQLTENLVALFDHLDPELRDRAKQWYAGARVVADRWASKYDISSSSVAGVIAVLSPQTDWFVNASRAERVISIWNDHADTKFTPEMLDKAGDIALRQGNPGVMQTLIAEIDELTLAEAAELGDLEAAAWVRMYDEAHNPGHYRILTPEGEFGDFATKGDGSRKTVAWGSFKEIAKAIRILKDPSRETVHHALGEQHKVRSFYNNILSPEAGVDVTIDTHAVAAALLRPLSQSTNEVNHNFSGTGSSSNSATGIRGTYALYADAYRRAAELKGVLPREMQSIVWEGVRAMFPQAKRGQPSYTVQFDEIWQEHKDGKLTESEARARIFDAAGAIPAPEWAGPNPVDAGTTGDSTFAEVLPGADGPIGRPGAETSSRVGGRAAARIAARAGQPGLTRGRDLQQGGGVERAGIRLTPDLRGVVMRFTASTDRTSFLHESGHLWLAQMELDVKNEGAAESLLADFAAIREWLGMADGEAFTDAHHEAWADAVERYLLEGNAPSVELQGAFERFATWLNKVYESLRARIFNNLEPTNEIRQVMDRMLATDEQIAQAQQMRGLDFTSQFQLPTTPDLAEWTPEEVERLRESSERAYQEQVQKHRNTLMAQARRQAKEDWGPLKAGVREEMTEQVHAQKEWQAKYWLQKGEFIGDPPRGLETFEPARLDKAAVVALRGKEALKHIGGGAGNGVWQKSGGLHPDFVAEVFGLPSGDALLEALSAMGSMKKEIDRRTDAEMLRRHGKVPTSEELELSLADAMGNRRTIDALLDQERVYARLGRKGQPVTPQAVLRSTARSLVTRTRQMDLRPHRYRAAAAKRGREALEAVAEGNYAHAKALKARQVFALLMEGESARRLEALEHRRKKAHDLLKVNNKRRQRLIKAGNRTRSDGTVEPDMVTIDNVEQPVISYWGEMEALLERFDFKKGISRPAIARRETLQGWIEQQEAQGEEVRVPTRLRNEAYSVPWRTLPVGELESLFDAMDNIEHLAKTKMQLITGREHRQLESIQNEVAEGILANVKPNIRNFKGRWFDAEEKFLSLESNMEKMEALVLFLDGGKSNGPVRRHVFRPLLEALGYEGELALKFLRGFTKLTNELHKGRYLEMQVQKSFPELKSSLSKGLEDKDGLFRREELISVALHWGTRSNRDKMVNGYKWDEHPTKRVLDAELTEQDWKYVQDVWDLIGQLWPDIVALEQKVSGVHPGRVEALEFETPFGTMRGGYMPIVYNPKGSKVVAGFVGKDLLFGQENAVFKPVTGHGFTEARNENFSAPIQLDLNVVPSHLVQVIHRLSHEVAIRQVDKITQSRVVQDAMNLTMGAQQAELFRPWLQAIAGDNMQLQRSMQDMSSFLDALRRNVTSATLAFRATTLFLQPLGNANSIAHLSETLGKRQAIKHWTAGMARSIASAAHFGADVESGDLTGKFGDIGPIDLYQQIAAVDPFMRDRIENYDREARDVIRRAKVHFTPFTVPFTENQDEINEFGMKLIGRMQLYTVDIPTWLAAYNGSIAVHGLSHEDAVDAAREAVSLSQGSAGTLDLSALQRGHAMVKAASMFSSYSFTVYAQLKGAFRKFFRQDLTLHGFNQLVFTLFLRLTVTGVGAALISTALGRNKLPEGDEPEDWARWAVGVSVGEGVSATPFLRDGSGAIVSMVAGTAGRFNGGETPVQRVYEAAINVPKNEDGADWLIDLLRLAGLWNGKIPTYPLDLIEKVKDKK